MSRGKERLDWSSKTLIVFQVRHFLRPWETVLPIRRGHCHHYCVPKDISHLLRVSTLNGDFIVEAHDTHPVQAIHPSEIHIRKAVSVVCQGKSAPLFGTNSLNSARGPSSVRPTVRAATSCQIFVHKVDAIRGRRDASHGHVRIGPAKSLVPLFPHRVHSSFTSHFFFPISFPGFSPAPGSRRGRRC